MLSLVLVIALVCSAAMLASCSGNSPVRIPHFGDDKSHVTEDMTYEPVAEPTEYPTEAPTESPTEAPTEKPTERPTEAPTEKPTEAPTESPTEVPTEKPTEAPTEAPTEKPTEAPTEAPTVYEINAVPRGYKIHGYCFDYIKINGDVFAGAGTSINVNTITDLTVYPSDTVTLQGWIGFDSKEIEVFGAFTGNDISNIVVSDSFEAWAEDAVYVAGGELAKRFVITVPVSPPSDSSVSFAVRLTDGTYVVLDRFSLTCAQLPTEEIPDSEIIKADREHAAEVDMRVEYSNGKFYTDAGLEYTASADGDSLSQGRFVIQGGSSLKINFDEEYERFSGSFNRFKLTYYSDSPLRAVVTYFQANLAVTDTVYLESGAELFSCLIQGYIDGKSATGLRSIEVFVLGGAESAEFALYDVTVESAAAIESNLTYIENSRYRLGIKLSWGGGISYLLDRQDGDASIGNLINNADTGRLVQQSYYGTSAPPYECGTYNGAVWSYNPVQGGNLYNMPSRIMDVSVNERSVYIKAQPRDWAKTELAICYMENTYTVYSDRIQVDNRFVDFSGYTTDSARHQELPAFYTIGYLNTFVHYAGRSPWTGGELSYERSLGFWGGNPSAYFNLNSGNTETWCAWINNSSGYGLGLYTPNIDILLAGRHGYSASPDAKDPADSACSYVAPLCTLKMVSFEPLEYSYLMTSGSIEEIRDTFNTYKDFSTNTDLSDQKFK